MRILRESRTFLSIGKILNTNVEATKRQLQQQTFKKFNYLKCQPQPVKDKMPGRTVANFKKFYANVVKGNANISDPIIHHLRKPNKTNI